MYLTTTESNDLDLQVGDVISELLVTDTIMWQVIKKTNSTVTVAMMSDTGYTWKDNPEAYLPVVFSEVELTDTTTTRTLRRRKDGMFWINSYRPAYRATLRRNDRGHEVYARRTDYSF